MCDADSTESILYLMLDLHSAKQMPVSDVPVFAGSKLIRDV